MPPSALIWKRRLPPAITWRLVRIRPLAAITKPLPTLRSFLSITTDGSELVAIVSTLRGPPLTLCAARAIAGFCQVWMALLYSCCSEAMVPLPIGTTEPPVEPRISLRLSEAPVPAANRSSMKACGMANSPLDP